MPAEARTGEMPAWLKEEITAEEPSEAASALAEEAAPEPAEAMQPWAAADEPPQAVAATPESEAVPVGDEALAWLESLAAKHGIKDEELVMPAEARTGEMPEWLMEAAEQPPEAAMAPAEAAPSTVEPLPIWQPPTQATAGIAAEGDMPDWLREAMQGQEMEAETWAPEPAPPAEPLPAWLTQADQPKVSETPESWPDWIWPPASEEEAQAMQAAAETPAAPQFKQPKPEPKPRPARRRTGRAEPPETRLVNARARMMEGNAEQALDLYEGLIERGQFVDDVVADLEEASERSPDRRVLRVLGDGYMQQDRLQRALDTYRKALGQT